MPTPQEFDIKPMYPIYLQTALILALDQHTFVLLNCLINSQEYPGSFELLRFIRSQTEFSTIIIMSTFQTFS
jgi:hypothetical protein